MRVDMRSRYYIDQKGRKLFIYAASKVPQACGNNPWGLGALAYRRDKENGQSVYGWLPKDHEFKSILEEAHADN